MNMIQKFIPGLLRGHAWIAGGYAVDPDTATDIDIWLCDIRSDNTRELAILALDEWWAAQGFCVELAARNPAYANESENYAKVEDWPENSAHIMISYEPILEVVNNFDLSITRKAVNLNGQIVLGEGYTSTMDPIVVFPNRATDVTEARLCKYMKRFGLHQGV